MSVKRRQKTNHKCDLTFHCPMELRECWPKPPFGFDRTQA
jgi:hypothetical protein